MAVGSTIKTLWKNRRHFKLHIFGITVLIVVSVFLVNLMSIKTMYDNRVDTYMSEAVMHTASFQMSLSGVKGTVNNIFIDSSKTKCFMLAKLNNPSALTMDAFKYQALLTNTTSEGAAAGTPREKIAGEIYMFGTTGTIGIYLKSDIPFENTMKRLTLRSFRKYTSNTKPYYMTMQSDAQYDQCHIYFNPGGTSSKTMDFLETHVDGMDFDMSEIHKQVNLAAEEISIRSDILKCYDDMRSIISRIGEYQNRLTTNYNLTIPPLPNCINGDYFDTVERYNETGEVIGNYTKFIPATVVPGGTDYDWYVGSLMKGYYNLVPDGERLTAREYILGLTADRQSRKLEDIEVETWYYADGTEVVFTQSMPTAYETEMKSTMSKYVSLLEEYVSLKKTYQTEYLRDLLELELGAETVGQAYTVRKDANAVLAY